jgi:hypothetical protein
MWTWLTPHFQKIFKENISKDTIMIWTSFLEVTIKSAVLPALTADNPTVHLL